MASAWGSSFGTAWASSWMARVAVVGGDDAPRAMEIRSRRRKRKKEREHLFEEIEKTIRSVLPKGEPPLVIEAPVGEAPAVADPLPAQAPAMERAHLAVAELVSLADGQHALLQRAAKLRDLLQAYETAQLRMKQAQEREAWEKMLAEEDELLLLS